MFSYEIIDPTSDFPVQSCIVPYMAHKMPPSVSPNEVSQTDVLDVANLYARCADYFLLQDGELPTLADAYELFTDVPPEKEVQDQTVWGWKHDNSLCAIAAFVRDYPCNGTWYLGFMIVDPILRGQGFGRLIYVQIEDWAASKGAKEIRLTVLEVNEASERFWRSLGFDERQRVGPHTFKIRSHRRIELSRPINSSLGSKSSR